MGKFNIPGILVEFEKCADRDAIHSLADDYNLKVLGISTDSWGRYVLLGPADNRIKCEIKVYTPALL